MIKYKPGFSVIHRFSFSQKQVDRFARFSGDNNPIHFDPIIAARSPIAKYCPPGKLSVHGMLTGAELSKIFGTLFPGPETIYLEQSLRFKRPMFAGFNYAAEISLRKVDPVNHVARLSILIYDETTKTVTIKGRAVVMNPRVFRKRKRLRNTSGTHH